MVAIALAFLYTGLCGPVHQAVVIRNMHAELYSGVHLEFANYSYSYIRKFSQFSSPAKHPTWDLFIDITTKGKVMLRGKVFVRYI